MGSLALFVNLLSNRSCTSPQVFADVNELNKNQLTSATRVMSGTSGFGGGHITVPTVPCASDYWIPGDFRAIAKHRHCCNMQPAIAKCDDSFVQDKRIIDEPAICSTFLPSKPCKMFSFGIASQWGFEEMIKDIGCSVFAFDPTVQFEKAHKEFAKRNNFVFETVGLKGNELEKNPNNYGKLGNTFYSMEYFTQKFGYPDILKLDCEGCEWGAFRAIFQNVPEMMLHIQMIILEIHVTKELRVTTTAIRHMELFFEHVFIKYNFSLSYMHENPGAIRDRTVHPILAKLGMKPHVCCYEIVLVKNKSQRQTNSKQTFRVKNV